MSELKARVAARAAPRRRAPGEDAVVERAELDPRRSLQEMMLALQRYWARARLRDRAAVPFRGRRGHVQPGDVPALARPEPWRVAYVEPSRRPRTGATARIRTASSSSTSTRCCSSRAPPDIVDQYFDSLVAIGIDPREHDLRLVEDDWESPTLGAAGLGWQVWMDGTEISQFTYFQQCGRHRASTIVSAELTYGLDRIGMMLQGTTRVQDLIWAAGGAAAGVVGRPVAPEREGVLALQLRGGRRRHRTSRCSRSGSGTRCACSTLGLVMPGYDCVIKCSHLFNVLDARGAISVSERVGLHRARAQAGAPSAALRVSSARELGYPLITDEAERATLAREDGGDERAVPRDLLFEIGVEELPTPYIAPALAQLEREAAAGLPSAAGFERADARSARRAGSRCPCAAWHARQTDRRRGGCRACRQGRVSTPTASRPRRCSASARARARMRRRCARVTTPKGEYVAVTVHHVGVRRSRCCRRCSRRWRRGSSSRSRCAGSTTTRASRARCAGSWRCSATRSCRCRRSGSPPGAPVAGASLPAPRRGAIATAGATCAALEVAAVIADPGERRTRLARADRTARGRREGARASTIPSCSTINTDLVEWPTAFVGAFDRALPRPAARGHRHGAARAPALLRGRVRRRPPAARASSRRGTATSAGSTWCAAATRTC